LLSAPGADGWEPVPENAENGFVLIVHGLNDGANLPGDKMPWMGQLQKELQTKLAQSPPEICLVDWHEAAGDPTIGSSLISKVSAIRPQAEEIGRLAGCKLAIAIKRGRIREDRPMHFIGHSAGGFVILSAARTLRDLGIHPANLRLSVLDTPLPDTSTTGDLLEVLKGSEVDFYVSSAFAQGVPADAFLPRFHRFDIPPAPSTSFVDRLAGAPEAHSYAHQWFIESVSNGDLRGFARSPLLPENGLKK
jgi:hypothetical protein